MYTQIAANKRKTILLIVAFIVIAGGLGWVFAQVQSRPVAFGAILVFSLVYAWLGYFFSARVALALTGARPIVKRDNPPLYRTIENLTIAAGLPMPKVYIIDDPAPNAFATGRDPHHAAVAVTTGLLDILGDSELEGVIAHELSHIGNYDIRVMGLVIVLATVIVYISDFFMRMLFWGERDSDNRGSAGGFLMLIGIAVAIIAPLIATLLRLAVSRQREYLADASGVLLTRYPEGLASALRKIAASDHQLKRASNATAHLFIENPLQKQSRGFVHLFSTHPPVEERIKRLLVAGKGL